MLIVGAGGLAKEVLEILHQQKNVDPVCFYDDVNEDAPDVLYGLFTVLRDMAAVSSLFANDNRFVVAVGQPSLRKKLYHQFCAAGGRFTSTISPLAQVGHYGTTVGEGSIVMAGTVITNDVSIGKGCLINPNSVISHDSTLGDFVEVSPGANITGNCVIGNECSIGAGAILLPKVKLGDGVIVGAGAVVTKDVKAGITVLGVPAKSISK